MITLEEFKEIIGKEEVEKLSAAELELLYRVHTTFSNYAYKDWLKTRKLGLQENKA